MARYSPMTFATGLTGLRGQRGEFGALWQVKETSKSKKAIMDWIEQENQRIQEAASKAGKGSLLGQVFGYLTALAAYSTLGPVGAALAGSGVAGATDYGISERATRDAVKMGALPGVLFGKEALRESEGTVKRAGRNVRETGLSKWIGTAIDVGKNVYSIANLHQFLNPADPAGVGGGPNAIDITSRAPSASDIYAEYNLSGELAPRGGFGRGNIYENFGKPYIDSSGELASRGGFGGGSQTFSLSGPPDNLLSTFAPTSDFSGIASTPELNAEVLNMIQNPNKFGRLDKSIFKSSEYSDLINKHLNEKFISQFPQKIGLARRQRLLGGLPKSRGSFIEQYLSDSGSGIDAYLKSLRGGR